jgi:biopolymer transport protein ExbD
MNFKKKTKVEQAIPTSSLPDIVFLLLIFFMVTTVFKEFTGLQVTLPEAKEITKLPGKRDVAYIWADSRGAISIDDRIVEVRDISDIMWAKRNHPVNPTRVTSMRIDRNTRMKTVTDVQQQLRKADCLAVNYSAKPLN